MQHILFHHSEEKIMGLSKTTQSEKDRNCYDLEISVDRETFDAAIQAVYQKNVKDIVVPGFRKGKAPRALIERRYGKIINMSSVAAEKGILDRVDYSAAKGGVLSLTRALALEVGQYNINVNCISPGMVVGAAAVPHQGTWLKRSGEPREIAALAAFLASDDSGFITGENHTIDGGRVLGVHFHHRKEK